MKRIQALVEQIIEEHKTLFQRMLALEEVANDAEALHSFEKAQESFMPGRLDQKSGLDRLRNLVNMIDEGLRAHFEREETAVFAVFEEQGDRELASSFHSLILEHTDLRSRLDTIRNHVSQLTGGEMSSHQWGATGHDMRAYINHTRKLLEAHAEVEQELLQTLHQRVLE